MENQVVICSVGDLMLSDSPLYVSIGFGSSYSKVKGKVFECCKEEFSSADIVIGNLESVVCQSAKKNLKGLQMVCEEEAIKELHDAGFNMLNIANNHCLQHGTAGLFSTKRICEENGMECTGIKDEAPLVKTINGIRFSFLSICLYTEFYQPKDIQYEDNIQRVVKTIKLLRQQDETIVIVLSIHWGDEFATYPSPTQVELAHLLIDCGADIILGHHSHVFQGIEKYHGGLIAYSQGNFVSDMIPELCRDTGIMKIVITGDRKGIDYSFIPYHINDLFLPEKTEIEWFAARQAELKDVLNHELSDAEYMDLVRKNHRICHEQFRNRFTHGYRDYDTGIYIQMMSSFVKRKIQRKIGTYPGRYDLEKALERAKQAL